MRSLPFLLLLFAVAGCSGGSDGNDGQSTTLIRDDGSSTDIGYLLNGDSANRSVSNWICASRSEIDGGRQDYVFAVWRDGRGQSTAIGSFSWELNGTDVEVTPDTGNFSIIGELTHDVGRDVITFLQFFGPGDIIRAACTREFSG